jgi:hypothetical protein
MKEDKELCDSVVARIHKAREEAVSKKKGVRKKGSKKGVSPVI